MGLMKDFPGGMKPDANVGRAITAGTSLVAKFAGVFFDTHAVIDAIGKANAKAMAAAGAAIRRHAQKSMPYRKRPSKPGQPPSAHKGQLKKLILFGFDLHTQSLVVGPVPLGGPAVVPPILEFGGQAAARKNKRLRHRHVGGAGEIRIGGKPCRTTKKTKVYNPFSKKYQEFDVTYSKLRTQAQADRSNDIQTVLYGGDTLPASHIAARPYMQPALTAELPNIPELWLSRVGA